MMDEARDSAWDDSNTGETKRCPDPAAAFRISTLMRSRSSALGQAPNRPRPRASEAEPLASEGEGAMLIGSGTPGPKGLLAGLPEWSVAFKLLAVPGFKWHNSPRSDGAALGGRSWAKALAGRNSGLHLCISW
jgi:hypothetical protein